MNLAHADQSAPNLSLDYLERAAAYLRAAGHVVDFAIDDFGAIRLNVDGNVLAGPLDVELGNCTDLDVSETIH